MKSIQYEDIKILSSFVAEGTNGVSLTIQFNAKYKKKDVGVGIHLAGEMLMRALFESGIINGWSANNVYACLRSIQVDDKGLNEVVRIELRAAFDFIQQLDNDDLYIVLCEHLTNT